MKLFSAQQIRNCDQFTIENEPISSINLVERATETCAKWIENHFNKSKEFQVFCGNGNNGADGFALARILYTKGFDVNVFIDEKNSNYSLEAEINLKKIQGISGITVYDFNEIDQVVFQESSVLVDAIFGTGLNRKIENSVKKIIQKLNQFQFPKISIDIPSGLFADRLLDDDQVVFQADETLSFQFWKKSFLHPETGKFCGNIHILDIGLSQKFIENEHSDYFVIDESIIRGIYRPRNEFSHKGSFGKTLIVAGSYGKIGAAVLATKAALKSGSGITFTCAPECGSIVLQSACPEAMFKVSGKNIVTDFPTEDEGVLGIGPGLGTHSETQKSFFEFLKNYKNPLVLDADALNLIAQNTEVLSLIPKKSIITPHPKEFERLFGRTQNSFERLELARKKAEELGIYIVLKDHHTQVITPDQKVFYNITGNSGMAKGGSGDVLLGIITSFLAQQYSSEESAVFGVWLHGKAGNFAAEKHSKEAMLPSDLIDELGNVFKILS